MSRFTSDFCSSASTRGAGCPRSRLGGGAPSGRTTSASPAWIRPYTIRRISMSLSLVAAAIWRMLFHAEIYIADVGAGSVRELERHVQAGDLVLELLPLAQLPRAFDDQVLQVEPDIDPVLRGRDVVLETKEPLDPGEQPPHDLREMDLQVAQDFLLPDVARVD